MIAKKESFTEKGGLRKEAASVKIKVDIIKNASFWWCLLFCILRSRKGVRGMGALKGKPHRKFTQAEKLAYISEYQDAHISQSKFAKEHGLNLSMFERWMKEHGEQGEAGLASHRDRCGNRYAALHTSKTLDEMGQLQLRMAKLEADVARLKKGYRVKGSGSQKEFVTGSGKSFRSSKI